MLKRLIIFFIMMVPFVSWTQIDRSVEVTGIATRKILADRITIMVTVEQGEECIIPSGKNYEKFVKECKAVNTQLVASRENILKGIIESYGSAIIITKHKGGMFRANSSVDYYLEFRSMSDLKDFLKKLDEYKTAFTLDEPSAYYTKMTREIYHQVRLESLIDARNKAQSMAEALHETLGQVLNIYESKPGNMGGWMDFVSAMVTTEGRQITKGGLESLYYGLSEVPDDEGYIICTASSFVRFSLK